MMKITKLAICGRATGETNLESTFATAQIARITPMSPSPAIRPEVNNVPRSMQAFFSFSSLLLRQDHIYCVDKVACLDRHLYRQDRCRHFTDHSCRRKKQHFKISWHTLWKIKIIHIRKPMTADQYAASKFGSTWQSIWCGCTYRCNGKSVPRQNRTDFFCIFDFG